MLPMRSINLFSWYGSHFLKPCVAFVKDVVEREIAKLEKNESGFQE